MDLIKALHYRYATKQFDPTKSVPPHLILNCLEAARLAPSSYGLQPYRYVVVSRGELKNSLSSSCYNQPQIQDCDTLLIAQARKNITLEEVDAFMALIGSERQQSIESLQPYRDLIASQIVQGLPQDLHLSWAQRQLYLSAGLLIAEAALYKIDVCPMEGFNPESLDRTLPLTDLHQYQSTLLLAVGYRKETDPALARKKVRWPIETFAIRL